jgi:hypothetical protein
VFTKELEAALAASTVGTSNNVHVTGVSVGPDGTIRVELTAVGEGVVSNTVDDLVRNNLANITAGLSAAPTFKVS